MRSSHPSAMKALALAASLACVALAAAGYDFDVTRPRDKYNPGKRWTPKVDAATYDPRQVNWNAVIESCETVVENERRIGNFFVRVAFHDSMAVDMSDCQDGDNDACGGADGGLLLNEDEQEREENAYDDFSKIASKYAIRIAKRHDASVADVLALCSSVAINVLSAGRVDILARGSLRLGRVDSLEASEPGQLPAADANTKSFNKFWVDRGFTVEEGVALMGSHSLIDEQACILPDGKARCNPFRAPCKDLRMFQWDNHFYHDSCTPTLEMHMKTDEDGVESEPTPADKMQERRNEMCKFTSLPYRAKALAEMSKEKNMPPEDDKAMWSIKWTTKGCERGAKWGANMSCPHMEDEWPYTVNDAFSALACQGKAEKTADNDAVRHAMRKFLSQEEWDKVLVPAFIKMVTKNAKWADCAKKEMKLQPQCSAVVGKVVKRKRWGRRDNDWDDCKYNVVS